MFSPHAFSRAWRQLHVFASNSDWLFVLFTSVAIGQRNYFGFGFATLNWKPLYPKKASKLTDWLKPYQLFFLSIRWTVHLRSQASLMAIKTATVPQLHAHGTLRKTETNVCVILAGVKKVYLIWIVVTFNECARSSNKRPEGVYIRRVGLGRDTMWIHDQNHQKLTFKTRAGVFYRDLKPRGAAEWF